MSCRDSVGIVIVSVVTNIDLCYPLVRFTMSQTMGDLAFKWFRFVCRSRNELGKGTMFVSFASDRFYGPAIL